MTIHWFCGWDPRDDLASRVAERSMYRHTSAQVQIHWLKDHELRRAGFYWRGYEVRPNGQMMDNGDGKPFSTMFSFSRFCVPSLARAMGIHDPVLFTDPDILWRADISELFGLWDDSQAVMCVQHQHQPKEATKFDGIEQTKYFRKNWSSVMLIHPDRTPGMNEHRVNNWPGSDLHALIWTPDDTISGLPKEWNHLVGYDPPNSNAKLVHFTLGTPDISARQSDEHSSEWFSYLTPREYQGLQAYTKLNVQLACRMGGA